MAQVVGCTTSRFTIEDSADTGCELFRGQSTGTQQFSGPRRHSLHGCQVLIGVGGDADEGHPRRKRLINAAAAAVADDQVGKVSCFRTRQIWGHPEIVWDGLCDFSSSVSHHDGHRQITQRRQSGAGNIGGQERGLIVALDEAGTVMHSIACPSLSSAVVHLTEDDTVLLVGKYDGEEMGEPTATLFDRSGGRRWTASFLDVVTVPNSNSGLSFQSRLSSDGDLYLLGSRAGLLAIAANVGPESAP